MKAIEDYSEKEYYRNKYLAKTFRNKRNFKLASKYYTMAQIHLNYYKMLILKSTL